MRSSKFIICLSIIICSLMVSIPTFYKVISENHRKLYIVTEKLVIEAAEKCYYDDKCKNTKITLKELYENNYLKDKVINPVTKEIYSDNSFVQLKKVDSTFNPV
ncbi:MAG: hypothetical protein IKR74_04775 [Bacilli bacterium]|nr:hypothetical protein [Bacilli bacterium]